MNRAFISEISAADEALLMQPETDGLVLNAENACAQTGRLRSFELFEEFSGKGITETITERRMIFEKAEARIGRVAEVDVEVERFRVWLEETKSLESETAHYYSVSLKSLLLGLPIGEQVAYLFGAILESLSRQDME